MHFRDVLGCMDRLDGPAAPAIYDEHLQRTNDVGVLAEVKVRRSKGTLEEKYLEMRLDDASLCVCMEERERERKQGVWWDCQGWARVAGC